MDYLFYFCRRSVFYRKSQKISVEGGDTWQEGDTTCKLVEVTVAILFNIISVVKGNNGLYASLFVTVADEQSERMRG